MSKKITAFADVFEQRLNIMKRSLKKELEKAKSDRRREWIKSRLKECKSMRDTLKDIKPKCPHCGGEL